MLLIIMSLATSYTESFSQRFKMLHEEYFLTYGGFEIRDTVIFNIILNDKLYKGKVEVIVQNGSKYQILPYIDNKYLLTGNLKYIIPDTLIKPCEWITLKIKDNYYSYEGTHRLYDSDSTYCLIYTRDKDFKKHIVKRNSKDEFIVKYPSGNGIGWRVARIHKTDPFPYIVGKTFEDCLFK